MHSLCKIEKLISKCQCSIQLLTITWCDDASFFLITYLLPLMLYKHNVVIYTTSILRYNQISSAAGLLCLPNMIYLSSDVSYLKRPSVVWKLTEALSLAHYVMKSYEGNRSTCSKHVRLTMLIKLATSSIILWERSFLPWWDWVNVYTNCGDSPIDLHNNTIQVGIFSSFRNLW